VVFHMRKSEGIPYDPQLRKVITGNFSDHREIRDSQGRMPNFPVITGYFSESFFGMDGGSEWMDVILNDDNRMKLDLDEKREDECLIFR
jgi:hypothetical protein